MLRSCDLRQKEVINTHTAKRLGYVDDIDIDQTSGRVLNIIIPKHRLFFMKREDYIIPWEEIVLIGDEIILVNHGDTEIIAT